MELLETEIKFLLPDLKSIRRRILKLGAHSKGRIFESNYRYDDNRQSLAQRRSLLRLRRDREAILTFKYPPPEESTDYKVRSELEVNISDFETMHLILKKLGFHREQVYEKWRETLDLDQVHFCLDEMPFGDFLEIEGPPERIRELAARLELLWDQRILMNYLQIFQCIKDRLKLNFSDLTFDNFSDIEVNLADFWGSLIAKG